MDSLAQIQQHRRLGRVVCVSGSRLVATLEDTETELMRVQKGAIVKIALPETDVFCMVAGLSVPVPAGNNSQADTKLVELEYLGETVTKDQGKAFQRGISAYPALGDTLHTADVQDLALIYEKPADATLLIGHSLQHGNQPVHVDPNALLGKHFAVLGTTGTGKSCAVAQVLRGLLKDHEHAHIVLLDPHDEYPKAFGDRAECLGPEKLQLPYWLFTAEEISSVLLGPPPRNRTADAAEGLLKDLVATAKGQANAELGREISITVDTPVPYRLSDLEQLIDEEIGRLEKAERLTPLKLLKTRLSVLRNDPRFSFMFGGIAFQDNMAAVIAKLLRIPADGKPLTIIDLSSVPSEVLNVVVSVLCRLVFDFAVWSRGTEPILLVCEEAHRYAPDDSRLGFGPAKEGLARIAKEGRKYGLSLCMVSQRPSELAPLILSQCSTVFAFRMTSLRDQEFVRGVIPDDSLGLLDFLPSLGDAEAIVAGQAVAVPVRVKIPKLSNEHCPSSTTGTFSTAWSQATLDRNFVEQIVDKWRRQRR